MCMCELHSDYEPLLAVSLADSVAVSLSVMRLTVTQIPGLPLSIQAPP
jgi:hypothetical protein